MTELWLNFKDEKGEDKRVLVEGEKFAIGRTPDNHLQIPLGNLSRQHARIERFGDVFVLVDSGSSNGTTLNGEKITDPVGLKKGDKFNLGEAVEIETEFVSDKPKPANKAGNADEDEDEDGDDSDDDAEAPTPANKAAAASASQSSGLGFIILAPILGIFLLLVLGGIILLISRPQEPEVVVKNDNYTYKSNDDDDDDDFPENDNKKTPEKIDTPTPANNSNGGSSGTTSTPTTATPEPVDTSTPLPKTSDDIEKVEAAAFSFLRRIAQNDPKPYLTTKKISALNAKISQFKGASALTENIKNAKKNSAQIASMAQTKNLKPQFLATAALAKLGNQRGDVVATAQSMLETLDNLSIVIGNELADDNLLVIAAFNQGVAGENLKLRDMMARLTKEFPSESSRNIRTIWFLKEKNKITDEEFEFALRFLAIGTITQNPKDFNVQAEALVF